MKWNAFPTVFLAMFTLVFAGATRADDLKAMEGTWKVEWMSLE